MQTRRKLTPIEMAIDRAAGHVSDGTAPVYITLRCPKCKKSMQTPADESDPEGTAVVEIMCPECNAGDFDSPSYLDASGKYINTTPED